MKKGILFVAFCCSCTAFAFDVPSVKKPEMKAPGAGAGDTASLSGDIDAFLATTEIANKSLGESLDSAIKAVASKEDKAKMQKELDEVKKTSDPKERDAKMNEIKTNYALQAANNPETEKRVKTADAATKKELGNSIGMMMGMVPFNMAAINTGSGIVTKTSSNPSAAAAVAGKIGSVKTGLGNLKDQMPKIKDLVSTYTKLAKAGNIEVKEIAPSKMKKKA